MDSNSIIYAVRQLSPEAQEHLADQIRLRAGISNLLDSSYRTDLAKAAIAVVNGTAIAHKQTCKNGKVKVIPCMTSQLQP